MIKKKLFPMHLNRLARCTCAFALLLICSVLAQEEPPTVNPTISIEGTDVISTPLSTISNHASTSDPASTKVSSNTSTAPVVGTSKPKKYYTVDDRPVCRHSSPDFNSCVKNIVQEAILRVKNGDKELNIPVIDPFRLNRTNFQYSYGNVRGRITMRDGVIYGFSNVEIKTLELKLIDDKIKMKALSHVPEIRVEGSYKAELTLNNVQLRPKGVFNMTLVNVDIDQIYEGGFYEADGHRFVRMSKFEAEPKVGDFKMTATGLFPDPTLNEIALNIVNQYWRQIFQAFLPVTRQHWGPMLLRQINEVMSVVPYDVFVVD